MTLSELADLLESLDGIPSRLPVVAGFDGFVDDLLHVVDGRHGPGDYEPIDTIESFAAWVAASAGKSGLRECVCIDRAPGGCTVNMGDGLMALGFPVHAFAGLGDPVDPAFAEFEARCASLDTVGMEPGRTSAYEFRDGKVMLCSFSHFERFTPEHLRTHAAGALRAAVSNSPALALTSWSVYPHMTECWRCLQTEILADLPHRPKIFLDLADPASRTPGQIREMVETLSGFESIGPTILSLNGNEANQLAVACGIPPADHSASELLRLAGELRDRAKIAEVGIHLIRMACVSTTAGEYSIEGPWCPHPKKSVGAGDRFNAGWLAAHLFSLSPMGALSFASAVSGFFVRNARSGTLPEIIHFLRQWNSGHLEESLS